MEITQIFIPDSVTSPEMIWTVLDQVIGQNVRVRAHMLWHQTQADGNLSPGEITIRYAQIQGLLDYANEVDQANAHVTNWLLEHFGWKFPTHENEDPL